MARETEKHQFRKFLDESEQEEKESEDRGNYGDSDFCPEYVRKYKIAYRSINFQLRF